MFRKASAMLPPIFLLTLSCFNVDTEHPAADSYEDDNTTIGAAAITIGERQERTLTDADVDWIQFTGLQGADYIIQTDGTTDTRLALYAAATDSTPSQTPLTADDDSGDKNNGRVILRTATAGIYFLEISSSNRDVGAYGLMFDTTKLVTSELAVTFPYANQSVSRYNGHYINWHLDDRIETIDIFLMHEDTVEQIIETDWPDNCSYGPWYNYSGATLDSRYRIGICDHQMSLYDTAFSGYFTIQ